IAGQIDFCVDVSFCVVDDVSNKEFQNQNGKLSGPEPKFKTGHFIPRCVEQVVLSIYGQRFPSVFFHLDLYGSQLITSQGIKQRIESAKRFFVDHQSIYHCFYFQPREVVDIFHTQYHVGYPPKGKFIAREQTDEKLYVEIPKTGTQRLIRSALYNQISFSRLKYELVQKQLVRANFDRIIGIQCPDTIEQGKGRGI